MPHTPPGSGRQDPVVQGGRARGGPRRRRRGDPHGRRSRGGAPGGGLPHAVASQGAARLPLGPGPGRGCSGAAPGGPRNRARQAGRPGPERDAARPKELQRCQGAAAQNDTHASRDGAAATAYSRHRVGP